jgi:hypothetical protein
MHVEIEALKVRLARAERIAMAGAGVIASLILVLFGMLVGHGGALARMQVRVPDALPVITRPVEVKPDPAPLPPSSKIVATSFVLRDATGRDRFSMGILPDNTTYFAVTDTTGTPQWTFIGRDSSVAMALAAGQEVGILMGVESNGEASVSVGIDHKVAIKTATDYRGARIVVEGEGGKAIGQFP